MMSVTSMSLDHGSRGWFLQIWQGLGLVSLFTVFFLTMKIVDGILGSYVSDMRKLAVAIWRICKGLC